ncbi:MAG: NUDIX domain-containing protein, partial [Clostridia bacterium]|nr:NUDIX domain-containing protein [Clostridia bacterium]
VKEEIGVDIKEAELTFLHEHKQRNYFMDIYLVRKDIAPEEIVLDKNETVDFKWVSQEEICKMIENREVVRSVVERFHMLANKL